MLSSEETFCWSSTSGSDHGRGGGYKGGGGAGNEGHDDWQRRGGRCQHTAGGGGHSRCPLKQKEKEEKEKESPEKGLVSSVLSEIFLGDVGMGRSGYKGAW